MFKPVKEAVAANSMAVKRAAVGAVAAGASVGAFAQTNPSSAFDFSPIVTSINAVVPAIVGVGGAVLGVVAVAWGIKMVRTFVGR